jgi:arylformamidase
MKFYDISIPIREDMIVYPGNPKPSISQYSSIPQNKVNASKISLGSHTGTHADSKLHIRNDVDGAEALPLQSFYGRCKVLDLTHIAKEIHKDDLICHPIRKNDIVLLKTRNSIRGYKKFRTDYIHIKLDAAKHLVSVGVKTLGFDYLSVKKFGGDDEVHELLINNLTLFEGIDLSKVSEGEYTFIGLPLRMNLDGALARVMLMEE